MWANEGFTDILSRGEEEKEVGERRKHKEKGGNCGEKQGEDVAKNFEGEAFKVAEYGEILEKPQRQGGAKARSSCAMTRLGNFRGSLGDGRVSISQNQTTI